MLTLGAVGFAAPWFLLGLLALPLVWLLLRITPPQPVATRFPAIRFLFGLRQDDDSSERTPLWMLLLRLLIAALLVLAAARPILAPGSLLQGQGEVVLAIDDGWASAPRWPAMLAAARAVLDEAARRGRPVRLLTTAPGPDGAPPEAAGPMAAGEAAAAVAALEPRPWPADRTAAADAVKAMAFSGPASAVWVSDGLGSRGAPGFAEALQRLGGLDVLRPEPGGRAMLLRPPERAAGRVTVRADRAGGAAGTVTVEALDEEGLRLAAAELAFGEGETAASGTIDRPDGLLNHIARFRIAGETGAGATALVGSDWRRRKVGLAAAGAAGHPLLDDQHYLRAALAPFASVVEAPVEELLEAGVGTLVLTDAAALKRAERDRLAGWVHAGGVLLRFSGPRLAESGADLLPVPLRRGRRELGGALTWSKPQRLGAFSATGPFAGLEPAADIAVTRQVLAEPGPELSERSWATLADGTPIVTGARLGEGWTALVHTSANADWSSLALSGLYPQILARLTVLGRGTGGLDGPLEPARMLDGFGRWAEPGPAVLPLPPARATAPPSARPAGPGARGQAPLHRAASGNSGGMSLIGGTLTTTVNPDPGVGGDRLPGPYMPPGLYGRDGGFRAVNLGGALPAPQPLAGLPQGVAERSLAPGRERPLAPWLLLACIALLVLDGAASLAYRGYLPFGAALAALLLAGVGGDARAGDPELLAGEVHLAYVVTGDAELDETSRAGLAGLTRALSERTMVEPGRPQPVDIEHDELAFFPLLFWPVAETQPPLSDRARARLAAYVAAGGMLVFDTRDHGAAAGGLDLRGAAVTPERDRLRRLLAGMRVPPLTAVPPDHVLTRAFYLLQSFAGRYEGGAVWVERSASRRTDSVTGYLIGSNDWAAAWAEDGHGRPLFAVTPGGERQREAARRFGINLVMHALTGNYKADQVHVPTILRRLDG